MLRKGMIVEVYVDDIVKWEQFKVEEIITKTETKDKYKPLERCRLISLDGETKLIRWIGLSSDAPQFQYRLVK